MRGSAPGRALWLGTLFYATYGYLFYAVGAAFTPLFLVDVATVALPLHGPLFSVPRLDLVALGEAMTGRVARVVATAYLAGGVGAGPAVDRDLLASLVTREVPRPIVASGHPTGVVLVIDLVLLVPQRR